MKTKKGFVFLSLALTSLLALGGCVKGNDTSSSSEQQSQSESSEPQPSSSSSEEARTYTVKFVLNGEVLQTSEVAEGELAHFDGVIPPVPTSDPNVQTRFRKWDKDITQPITADTTFNAIMKDYALEQMVDNFESYTSTGRMLEAKWMALTYSSSGWTDQTAATVSLSTNSIIGTKALRLDAWSNDCDYKIAKVYDASPFDLAANALSVRMMFPRNLTVKVLIHTESFTGPDGKTYTPYFSYLINSTTSEYSEYVLPLADDNWFAWGEQGKSMASIADWAGIHVDDLPKYITRIEFYTRGATISGGAAFAGFLDEVKFVTLDDAQYRATDEMKDYDTYTGVTTSGQRVRIRLSGNGEGVATLLDLPAPMDIPGVYTIENNVITFSSADDGAALVYQGQLLDGGQHIKFLSADGAFADEVENMDIHAVQVVDNFNQYTEDGVSWWDGNKDNPEARSGCRGAYYSEYYSGSASDSAPWGKGGWSLLRGDGDQLKLATVDGNQCLSLKASAGAAMRYMQWGMYDGTSEKQAYRGNKFSFWAKSEGIVSHIKVLAYSTNKPTAATVNERCRVGSWIQEEGTWVEYTDWTHFEIELNPDLVYYGFIILLDWNRTRANATLYVDDIEVYTVNPYKS